MAFCTLLFAVGSWPLAKSQGKKARSSMSRKMGFFDTIPLN
jgi:hypothetical protein